jgi:anti-anti-sigma factor
VRIAGELDMAATFRIEPELERMTHDTDVRTFVVDIEGVSFMDSSGLGLLFATQERLRAHGIELLVANPSDSVRRMLALTRASAVLSLTTWPPGHDQSDPEPFGPV